MNKKTAKKTSNKNSDLIKITTRSGEVVFVPRHRMPKLSKKIKEIKETNSVIPSGRKDKTGKAVARVIRRSITEERIPAAKAEEIMVAIRRAANEFVADAKVASAKTIAAAEKLFCKTVVVKISKNNNLSSISNKADLAAIKDILSRVEIIHTNECEACMMQSLSKMMTNALQRLLSTKTRLFDHSTDCRNKFSANALVIDVENEPAPVGKPDERGFQRFSDGSFSQTVSESLLKSFILPPSKTFKKHKINKSRVRIKTKSKSK